MSEAPPQAAGNVEDAVGQTVVKALRDLITQAGKPEKAEAAAGSRARRITRLVVLMLAAIDVSALLWALDAVIKHPFFQLILKAVPALFGITIAAYIDTIGKLVRDAADRWWFRTVTVVAAALLVTPLLWPYSLPLVVPDGAHVYLDSATAGAVLTPVRGDSVRMLGVRGFGEHRLIIQEYDTLRHAPRKDTYSLGPRQLVRAGIREVFRGATPLRHYAISASTLSPVTIVHPPTATVIEVRDTFPELFLRQTGQENYVSEPDARDRYTVSFVLSGGKETTTLYLPPGRYHIRYHSQAHCWSDRDSVVVFHALAADLDLSKSPCTPDPLDP